MTDYLSDPEYLALLESVRTNPADDAPRGILADWIQDAGDDARAGFIREQLAGPPWQRLVISKSEDGEWNGPEGCDEIALHAFRDSFDPKTIEEWGYAGMVAYERGFASVVCLPLPAFLKHARMLFLNHPLVEVVLTDRRPVPVGSDWGWPNLVNDANWDEVPEHFLPFEIADRLPPSDIPGVYVPGIYSGESSAAEALIKACVSFGRDRVGLPALPA